MLVARWDVRVERLLSDMEAFELMQGLGGVGHNERPEPQGGVPFVSQGYYNDDLDSVGMKFSGRWAWDPIYQYSIHVIRTM